MATADPRDSLLEEATCSICRELFTDPVTLDCGHNFCLSCLRTYKSEEDLEISCPECKQDFDLEKDMKPNKRLANMVELAKELQIAPRWLCEEHVEKLQLFCETDGGLLCVSCMGSHVQHRVTSVNEAQEKYKVKLQDCLSPVKKEIRHFTEFKLREEEQYNTLRNKVRSEKQKIVTEIKQLHQLLRDKEQTLYERLEVMEKRINMVENANIYKRSSQITSLEALITEVEKKCKEPALDLLKDIESTLNRFKNMKFQGPEQELKKRKEKETYIEIVKAEVQKEYKGSQDVEHPPHQPTSDPRPARLQKTPQDMALQSVAAPPPLGTLTDASHTETEELRLVLIGSPGAGKSATGNSILGRREFVSKASAVSVTRECQRGEVVWEGRTLLVVDTPGFLSPTVPAEELSAEIERCAQLSAPAPHALLLVLQAGRFTKEERESVQRIQRLFGKEALKSTVIVFTRKEDLVDKTIDTFVDESEKKLKGLVRSCGGRVCAFNNRATGAEREEQVRGLIQVIDTMLAANRAHITYIEGSGRRAGDLVKSIKERREGPAGVGGEGAPIQVINKMLAGNAGPNYKQGQNEVARVQGRDSREFRQRLFNW